MKKAFTLIEAMIIIALIALIGSIIMRNVLKIVINRNETYAVGTLKTIATACQAYAEAHNGTYPITITDLTNSNPPYLKDDYTAGITKEGYSYNCLFANGYTCTALPEVCIKSGQLSSTGSNAFTMKTGGVLTKSACDN